MFTQYRMTHHHRLSVTQNKSELCNALLSQCCFLIQNVPLAPISIPLSANGSRLTPDFTEFSQKLTNNNNKKVQKYSFLTSTKTSVPKLHYYCTFQKKI